MSNSYTIPLIFPDGSSNSITAYPSGNVSDPVIIIFPAMGLRATYYSSYADALSKNGIQIVTIDHRGHGNSSLRPSRNCNFGYKEQVEIEYPAILENVKLQFPESKIIVMGHSLGGQMGSIFLGRHPHLADGFIMNATCSVYYKGWDGKQRWGVRAGAELCRVTAAILGYYPGHKLGFGGLEAKGVIKDWYHVAITGKYKVKDSDFDYESAMQNCRIPILTISYEGDNAAPGKALDNLVNKFNSAEKTRFHLSHPSHPAIKYDHYSWVKDPDITLPIIKDWIKTL